MREMNLVWCIALVAAALAGFAAGIRYAQLRPPPTKIAQQSVESPLTSNKSHHDDLSLYDVTVARRSDSDGAKRWLAVSSPIVPLDNAGFASAATPGKRIAFDVGLGRNSPAAQLWLKLQPDPSKLHVFGIEGNPFTAWSIRLGKDPRFTNDLALRANTWALPSDLQRINESLTEFSGFR